MLPQGIGHEATYICFRAKIKLSGSPTIRGHYFDRKTVLECLARDATITLA